MSRGVRDIMSSSFCCWALNVALTPQILLHSHIPRECYHVQSTAEDQLVRTQSRSEVAHYDDNDDDADDDDD